MCKCQCTRALLARPGSLERAFWTEASHSACLSRAFCSGCSPSSRSPSLAPRASRADAAVADARPVLRLLLSTLQPQRSLSILLGQKAAYIQSLSTRVWYLTRTPGPLLC